MIRAELYKRIVLDIQSHLKKLSHQNDFEWFYNLHQLEMVGSAELLLKYHTDADKKVVILASWLHDIVQYVARGEAEAAKAKANHHIDGAIMANEFLSQYQLPPEDLLLIQRCIERHRNREGYRPESIEEKIVASADAMSHFYSVFFLTFFKFHPSVSVDEMVRIEKEKLEKDWLDANIIPEAGEIVKARYLNLKNMLNSYGSNFKG